MSRVLSTANSSNSKQNLSGIPDIEDLVPDPLSHRARRLARKRRANGEVIGRLPEAEREEGRLNLMPRVVKELPYVPQEISSTKIPDPRRSKRAAARKGTPHPSASNAPVPTCIVHQDAHFPRAEDVDIDID